MNVLHCSVSLLLLAALTLRGAEPPPRYSEKHSFDEKVTMSVWPQEKQQCLVRETTDIVSGTGALKVVKPAGSLIFYSGMALQQPGPGTFKLSFMYKFLKPAGKFSGLLNFNLPGQGNGSAGNAHFDVPEATDWKKFEQVFTVPAATVGVQYVLTLEGSETELLLDDIEVSFMPDEVTVPVKAGMLNAALSDPVWNPGLVSYGFYTRGKPGLETTAIQFAADQQGLYVAFRNLASDGVKATVKEPDGALWRDDCNTVFLFDRKRQQGWQFAVNAINTRYDAALKQRVPGDPWHSDKNWSGAWQSRAERTPDGYITCFLIPWATLGLDASEEFDVAVNFTRESKSSDENTAWNDYSGTFFDVGKYGILQYDGKNLTVRRNRNNETLNFTIARPTPQFAALTERGVPGGYQVDLWSQGINRSDFPKTMMAHISDAEFSAWQDELLRAWGEAGIGGPPWPWTFELGRGRVATLYEKYHMLFPFAIDNSDLGRAARRNGAKYFDPGNDFLCDPIDPAYAETVDNFIRSRAQSPDYEWMQKTLKFAMGIDEPTNAIGNSFDPRINREHAADLAELSRKIRQEYGFGRFGSPFDPECAAADLPLARIAFYRWWNAELKKTFARHQASFKAVFPGKPFHLTTDNNVSGQSNLDAANLNDIAELIACDPYPTSANASYGMARAIYHTGFSTRVLHDLVPNAQVMTMPQCFIYHGAHGDPAAMREWASQALKNGASRLMWYCESAPWEIFDDYAAMLELSKEIATMDKLPLPTETRTLIWYSNFDKWAKQDFAQHALYSIYAILGEGLKSNFRIVSDTALTAGTVKLADYKLLYVPAMTYTTPEIAQAIAGWVKAGGTLVVFDPLFMSRNIDGSAEPARRELTGAADLAVKTSANGSLGWNGKTLPLAAVEHIPAPTGSRFASYVLTPAAGDRVLMTYPDGTAAAIERRVGQGKVVFFAAQPFGNSELAVRPDAWLDFFAMQARTVGEPVGLPIWDFLLPDPPKVIQLKQMIR